MSAIELTSAEKYLIDICFKMKVRALIQKCQHIDDEQTVKEKQIINNENYRAIFLLWQRALPYLENISYKHYWFTFGMRNIKGKPRKKELTPCVFGNQIPKLCFIWKERLDYYKLELRFMIGRDLFKISNMHYTSFFVTNSENADIKFLLNSLMDCELVDFFYSKNFQMVIIKEHYEGLLNGFVDKLRGQYLFISK